MGRDGFLDTLTPQPVTLPVCRGRSRGDVYPTLATGPDKRHPDAQHPEKSCGSGGAERANQPAALKNFPRFCWRGRPAESSSEEGEGCPVPFLGHLHLSGKEGWSTSPPQGVS